MKLGLLYLAIISNIIYEAISYLKAKYETVVHELNYYVNIANEMKSCLKA